MAITYNLLNLPTQALFDNGSHITWLYDAAGVKLRKTVHKPNQNDLVKDYVGGIEYYNGALEAIYTAEGRCVPQDSTYRYEYALKDHLGSGRLYFSDLDGDGEIKGTLDPNDANYDPANDEILQEAHTYSFGMEMEGAWNDVTGSANRYQFTGKELNLELDLGWIDFGSRWYEPALGRWGAVDPMCEASFHWTPYRYAFNNPISFIDPNGKYEIGNITLSNEEEDKLANDYQDKKERKQARKELIEQKKNEIRNLVGGVKKFLDDNSDIKKIFSDFSGYKEGSKSWENLWTENGKGNIYGMDGNMESMGLTSIDQYGQSTTILKGGLSFEMKFGTLLHEIIHSGDNIREDRYDESKTGVPGYDLATQISAIEDAIKYSVDKGLHTKQDFLRYYGPNSPAGYPKLLDSEGKAIGVEIGYAFEKIALGSVLTSQEEFEKRFSAYKK